MIRGVDRDTVVLDGGDAGGNVLAIEGSYAHVERLTLQHDTRALRFHGSGATGNVVRRVHARDVTLGFGSNPDQQDFYLCDNLLEGGSPGRTSTPTTRARTRTTTAFTSRATGTSSATTRSPASATR